MADETINNPALMPKDPLSYNYATTLPFETSYDMQYATEWMQKNWTQSIGVAIVYVVVIFGLQHYMSFRKRFTLATPLIVWNTGLAAFSILGAIRVYPEFIASLKQGYGYSACNNSYAQGVTLFWAWLFALSKIVELGDTIFVVFRKQQLIFLHWYHHITVMMYTWYSFQQHTASGRWFITMNLTVHAFMYTYYAARAWGIRPSKWVPWTITSMQLAQMCLGCAVNFYSYYVKLHGERCDQSFENLYAGFVMYATYFALFARFFHTNYYTKTGKFAQRDEQTRTKRATSMAENGALLFNSRSVVERNGFHYSGGAAQNFLATNYSNHSMVSNGHAAHYEEDRKKAD